MFKRIGLVLIILLLLIAVLLVWLSVKKSVPDNYWEKAETGGAIEEKYATLGWHEVDSKRFDAPEDNAEPGKKKFYEVWYPKEEGMYPLIVMVNGTGVPCNKYDDVFKHMASHGYVVVGNNYGTNWDGKHTSETLEFALSNTEITGKIDKERIGVGGHSQGGIGTFNAITAYENGAMYKVAFTISPTNRDLSLALNWGFELETEKAYAYKLEDITIPVLMISGSGAFDAETVIPLAHLENNYGELTDDKVMYRRANTDHGDMLYKTNAYIIAWLDYYLKDKNENERAFFGENAEISNNTYYQDFRSDKQHYFWEDI